jgi:hypothetical protein
VATASGNDVAVTSIEASISPAIGSPSRACATERKFDIAGALCVCVGHFNAGLSHRAALDIVAVSGCSCISSS